MKFAYNLAQTLDVCIPGAGQFDNQLMVVISIQDPFFCSMEHLQVLHVCNEMLDFLHDVDH